MKSGITDNLQKLIYHENFIKPYSDEKYLLYLFKILIIFKSLSVLTIYIKSICEFYSVYHRISTNYVLL